MPRGTFTRLPHWLRLLNLLYRSASTSANKPAPARRGRKAVNQARPRPVEDNQATGRVSDEEETDNADIEGRKSEVKVSRRTGKLCYMMWFGGLH